MSHEITADDYVIRVHADPAAIDAVAWNTLLETQSAPTPFLRHAYLLALHQSQSAVPDTGWAPQIVTIEAGGVLVAATVLYLKSHSYGEYEFLCRSHTSV
jgi:uncharacterized protein